MTVLLLTAAAPAAGLTPAAGTGLPDADLADAGPPADAAADAVRTGVADDPATALAEARRLADAAAGAKSAVDVLRAALASRGLDAAPAATGPGTPPAGAPPALAGALGRLVAAADAAETLRAQALAELTDAEQARLLDALAGGRSSGGADIPLPADAAIPTPATPPTTPAPLGPEHRRHEARVGPAPAPLGADLQALRDRVDADLLRAAGLTLLAAAEDAARDLGVVADGDLPMPRVPSMCGASGDMVFESDGCEVMVGNTGPNGYGPGVDPVVLIDLGGDDVYTNGAALAVGSVRVLVDVEGDDTYTEAASAAAPGGPLVVEGQARARLGVAVLVDGLGDDAYTATAAATAPEPGPPARDIQIHAQGAADVGAAILVDGGGRDAFTVTGSSSGDSVETAGQGHAAIGLGALVNLGAVELDGDGPDDAYTVSATSTLHNDFDDGFTATFVIGPADVRAQGAADAAGAGILVDAGGDDAYDARGFAGGVTFTAQGAASGGAGVLVDGLGSDRYDARALSTVTLELVTLDPSICWEVFVSVGTGDLLALAQGAAELGAGVLADGAGDDIRLIVARNRAEAIAEAFSDFDCSIFGGNKAFATADAGRGIARGQGAGGTAGVGVLADVAGADTHTLDGSSTALARAIAVSPGPDVEEPDADSSAGTAQGQGFASAGFGLLADGLGDDAYGSVVSSFATEVTSAIGASLPGPTVQEVQGFGLVGAGWLLELDGDDTYATSPAGFTAGDDLKCWSNGPDGRGRDLAVGSPLPGSCP